MTGYSYRLPAYPVAPGTEVPESDMEILTVMPVKSLVTFRQTGSQVAVNQTAEVRAHAWAGKGDVAAVEVSIDLGQTWTEANPEPAPTRYACQRWPHQVTLPDPGH